MIDDNSASRNRFINGILLAAALTLLAASIYSVYVAWRTGLAQSRVETASRLMTIRTSPRSTETPGINAWVSWSLLNSASGSESENQRLRDLVLPRKGNLVPAQFRGLLESLRTAEPENPGRVLIDQSTRRAKPQEPVELEFRQVDFVENQDHLFVLTSRKDEAIQNGIKDFCDRSTAHLIAINQRWNQQPTLIQLDFKRIKSARVARFYVLNEDESLISMPVGISAEQTGVQSQTQESLHISEGIEFTKNPLSPSFVSNNFFFNFEFDKTLADQASYSGIYLDLGGYGLVASVTIPVIYNGKRSVLGADIAFDMDWKAFAQHLSPNLESHVAYIQDSGAPNWSPWNEFLQTLPDHQSRFKDELQDLARRESSNAVSQPRKSVYLAATRRGGDVMAIQVNRMTWLLLMVAANEVQIPWTLMLLTGLVFLGLLFRIEQRRRQAVKAQKSARGEMQEKQNLLDTMQVPLMVVDPNTDQLVFCNRAAESIGMSEGRFFGKDIVAPDEESQDHYRNTQSLSEEQRRAYGVQIRPRIPGVDSGETADYAIVRSVAVTAPIESLGASQRHRLGILFIVNEERDLEPLLRKRITETRNDEKRQLSGLLNHGIDSLARILKNRLNSNDASTEQAAEFEKWLAAYLSARIQLLAWTLDHWGKTPVSTDEHVIERKTVEMTFARFEQIFRIAAEDRQLREQLHWNNGIVSGGSQQQEFFLIDLDWSDESCFSVPREGVFGFFVSEVMVNAVRHGKPGSPIRIEITENRVRNELTFSVENETNGQMANSVKPFGGVAIISELARLSGWTPPINNVENNRYRIGWSVPMIHRKVEGQGD